MIKSNSFSGWYTKCSVTDCGITTKEPSGICIVCQLVMEEATQKGLVLSPAYPVIPGTPVIPGRYIPVSYSETATLHTFYSGVEE